MQKIEVPIKDLPATNINMFLFFSELLGRFVVDEDGVAVGKLADLKLRLAELFPTVATLVVKKRREKKDPRAGLAGSPKPQHDHDPAEPGGLR